MPATEILLIIGAFLLRLGVPLAVTILVTWLLHRLDAHWRGQTPHPPSPQSAGAGTTSLTHTAATPCWEVRGCAPAQRASCAAYAQPSIACWLVHLRRDGRLPGKCRTCLLFTPGGTGVPAGTD